MSIGGHFWTIAPHVVGTLRPTPLPAGEPWQVQAPDGCTTTGTLHSTGSARLVIIIHGLGGHFDSIYVRVATKAALANGFSVLRVNLRGADRAVADFYSARLTTDLHAALASPSLAHFTDIYLWGFSLGGHIALRYTMEVEDPRVRRVVAVCPPLDLAATSAHLDRPRFNTYRTHILRGLKAMYRQAAKHGPLPTPYKQVRKARNIRTWDSLTVVPHYDYVNVDAYYAEASAGPKLGELRRPSLILLADDDPLVPTHCALPFINTLPDHVTVRIAHGGHVAFPPGLQLGFSPQAGLEQQVCGWLLNSDRSS